MSSSSQENSNYDNKSSFFSELSSSIEYGSILDCELNRKLAHKFNVFEFVRTKEIGLSQIIAHWLNPMASHGQGAFFLQQFLKVVEKEKDWNHLDSHTVKVETEHNINVSGDRASVATETIEKRRIDIYVEIQGDKPFGLAIENKPYGEDRENQVLDYLKYLDEKFSDFLVVYLSGNGQWPSETSFPREERIHWEEKFTVMAYAESGDDSDEFGDTEKEQSGVQRKEVTNHVDSLTTWIKVCKEKTEVDRLRWFLGDAEDFFAKTFGKSKLTDGIEVQIVKSFLFENTTYLDTAYAVNRAWPHVVNEAVERFIRYLADTISQEFVKREDIQYSIKPSCEDTGYHHLCLFNEYWVQYENPTTNYSTKGRYCIVFSNNKKNELDKWYVGISAPLESNNMDEEQEGRFNKIKNRLDIEWPGILSDSWYPGYIYESEKRDWEPLLKKLLDEIEQKGDLSDYYVKFIWNFAEKAISILDCIEKPR